MAFPSVTNTFANSTVADATQVNQNFQDLLLALSDGTKDAAIAAFSAAGLAVFGAAIQTNSFDVIIATNGGTHTIADDKHIALISPASSIAAATLKLPANPGAGHRVLIVGGANSIGALTFQANTGHSLVSGLSLTRLAPGMAIEVVFRSNVWYPAGGGSSSLDVLEADVAPWTAYPNIASATWGDLDDISLTAGTWELHAQVNVRQAIAGNVVRGFNFGLGTTAGANAPNVGLPVFVLDDNGLDAFDASFSNMPSAVFGPFKVAPTTTTSYYLKSWGGLVGAAATWDYTRYEYGSKIYARRIG